MFEDSLLDSGCALSHRSWTTAASFAAQILLGGVLALLSLVYTQVLPQRQLMSMLEAPVRPPLQHSVSTAAAHGSASAQEVLTPPSELPRKIAMAPDEAPAPAKWMGIAGDNPGGLPVQPTSVIPEIVRSIVPNQPKMLVQKVRVSSGVAQGMLIRQVRPEYPALARQARVQGLVVLQAIIGKDGSVENLRLISGHPLLAPAALDAARQWQYKPYYLNGEPVEVKTYINVNFTLAN